MTLHEYLAEANLTPAQFAAQIGVSREWTVKRWLSGDRVPDIASMRIIATATGCKVTPNDWLAVKAAA